MKLVKLFYGSSLGQPASNKQVKDQVTLLDTRIPVTEAHFSILSIYGAKKFLSQDEYS